MKIHITNLHGMVKTSVVLNAQNMVAQVAKSMGIDETAVYFYDVEVDSAQALSSRLDGILSDVSNGDIVIIQSPTWNARQYNETLFWKLKGYADLKIIYFVHDVAPLMFSSNYYLMPEVIKYYNLADALILPTEKMYNRLREEGLTNDKVIFQEMWDHPVSFELNDPIFKKDIHFLGNPKRFPFIKKWSNRYPINLYGNILEPFQNDQITLKGYMKDAALLMELSKGGFGLCWSENFVDQAGERNERDYSTMNVSYKLSTYLAAGLPLFVNKDISSRQIIEENDLGYVISDLSEIDSILDEMTPERYDELKKNVASYSHLIKQGFFTKKLLVDAIHMVLKK